jgi:hypothetical protein
MPISIHRAYAIILALFTGALVLFTSAAFITNILQTGGETSDTGSTGTGLSASSVPSLTLIAQHLSPAQRTLQGSLVLVVPPLQGVLVDAKTHRPLAVCRGAACSIQPAFRSRIVSLSLASEDATNPYQLNHALRLGDLLGHGRTQQTLAFPVAVPLDGSTELYPNDVYRFTARLGLSLPDIGVRAKDGTVHAWGVTYAFDAGDLGKSLDIHWRFVCGTQPPCGQSGVDVTVARKAPEQWFIESVALVPVIFALLFLHLLFFHPRYRGLGLETFLVPLIAAILAILPLRLVLVPSNIEGLTRVDVALGAGLVLTVAVALAKYLWEIWNVTDGGSAGADGEAVPEADQGS